MKVWSIGVLFLLTSVQFPQFAQSQDSVQEVPPEKSAYQKVDGIFKYAVDAIEQVLFYRLGKGEQHYILFERATSYTRAPGSNGVYTSFDGQVLAVDQVQVFSARGELLEGHTISGEQKNYRLGNLNDKPVEYVTIKQSSAEGSVKYGTRFAYDSTTKTYRIIHKKRNLLGEETVSQVVVDEWNSNGWLKQVDEPVAGQPSYLLSRPVGGIPFVVAWLACGAVFFTLYMQGFNFWGFGHALAIVTGKYDNPAEAGEVTHFQALSSALSATIGLGNIAGVTIAMTLGGPGAFFWMLLCGLLGMCTKFVECTLGLKYRTVKPDGTVLGGPMRYLKVGLDEMQLGILGSILSFVFAIMCVLASFGGGNMLQANQAGSAMLQMFQQDALDEYSELNDNIKAVALANDTAQMQELQSLRNMKKTAIDTYERNFKIIYGVILAGLVGVVIIGGIKRIASTACRIVPTMCLIYSAACLFIIIKHITLVPELVVQIFQEAFTGNAMGGGIVGVLVVGVQRAAFSNEAGAGSAAIAHSAAKTEEPIREGCVALLEPFIDTIVICSMTALVILITGAWDNQQWIVEQGLQGSALTSRAFKAEISWFPLVLSIAVTLFAYSTIISWSYYGERAWESLFGLRTTGLYKILAVICVFIGTIVNLGSVLDFSDMMILGMAFPNIAGILLLSPKVKKDLFAYWKRYKAGEFKTYS